MSGVHPMLLYRTIHSKSFYFINRVLPCGKDLLFFLTYCSSIDTVLQKAVQWECESVAGTGVGGREGGVEGG